MGFQGRKIAGCIETEAGGVKKIAKEDEGIGSTLTRRWIREGGNRGLIALRTSSDAFGGRVTHSVTVTKPEK